MFQRFEELGSEELSVQKRKGVGDKKMEEEQDCVLKTEKEKSEIQKILIHSKNVEYIQKKQL